MSIIVNTFLFGLKYWAGLATGSVAIIADAWHTLSDSISSLIVLVGVKVSTKPADRDHPFGHGRTELIASIIIGVLLIMIAWNFLQESAHKLTKREGVVFGQSAMVVMVVSIVFKEALAQFASWGGRKTGSTILKADAWHHRSDAVSSIIILIGIFAGKYFWWIDGVLGIIVSLLITWAAFKILRESANPLLGRKPDKKLITKIKGLIRETHGREISSHHFHIHEYGRHSELTFHIRLSETTSLKEAHQIASAIEIVIKNKLDIETTIHMEPLKEKDPVSRNKS